MSSRGARFWPGFWRYHLYMHAFWGGVEAESAEWVRWGLHPSRSPLIGELGECYPRKPSFPTRGTGEEVLWHTSSSIAESDIFWITICEASGSLWGVLIRAISLFPERRSAGVTVCSCFEMRGGR